MKAILLAGGKGTRLRPLTIHTPKPIVPIFNRPFLHYQIDLLKQVPEIDEVILSLNYQPRRIEEIFGDGSDVGHQDPLRRRAGAARHRRRHQVRRRQAHRIGRRVQRRRADPDRSGGRHPPAPRAAGPGDDRPDAGGQPDGVRPGRDRRATATSGGFSRSRSPTRSPPTTSTPASTSSSPTPSTGSRATWPGRSSAATSPRSIERGETFVAYIYNGYWIDIGTPEKYTQVHRDIMDGRYARGAVPRPAGAADCDRRRTPASRTGATIEGPCFIDEGVLVKAGARIGPYSVIGRQTQIEEDAVGRRRDHLAELPRQPRADGPQRHRRPQLPPRAQRHASTAAPCSATRRR